MSTVTRRFFVKDSAVAMVGVGCAPAWLARAASTSPQGGRKVLVAIFQRGAADGLNMVIPYTDQQYYQLRPGLAVPPPGKQNGAIDLDGRFGLHPSLSALKPLFEEKSLAVVEATGSPDPTRSHFDAQDYMESGTPGRKSTRDGWLNRSLAGGENPSPVRAVALGSRMPRTLRGSNAAVAIANLRDFQVRDRAAAEAFRGMYSASVDAMLQGPARDTFDCIRLLQSLQRQSYTPAAGVRYPQGRFAQSLQEIARLIKADVGVEAAFADSGGWDHHINEGPQMTTMLREFGDSLAAFYRDLGDLAANVAIVTMSEFGRTARENGNRGTDHGHGGLMFVLGGGVRGGKVHGQWPGLAPEQLYQGRDLAVTTDFRAVLSELILWQRGGASLATVFPGFQPSPAGVVSLT